MKFMKKYSCRRCVKNKITYRTPSNFKIRQIQRLKRLKKKLKVNK